MKKRSRKQRRRREVKKTELEVEIPPAELVPITFLTTDHDNPNRMGARQIAALKQSVQRWGFIVPIITNKELLVADGEQRLTVAQELGMKQVSVIRLPVKDVERRLLRQVLNKLRGEHELLADAYEFQRIIDAGYEDDLKYLLSLNDSKIELYLAEIQQPKNEDFEVTEIDKIQTNIQRGDVYKLGEHLLLCGDSTILEEVQRFLDAPINMVFTDPPYGVKFDKRRFHNESFIRNPQKSSGTGFKNWGGVKGDATLKTYLIHLSVLSKTAFDSSWYLCAPSRHLAEILAHLNHLGVYYATPIVWVKEHWVMSWERYHAQHENIIFAGEGAHPTGKKSIWYGRSNESTVWQINRDNMSKDNLHPTQKPLELIRRALLNSSTKGQTVYDGFGGSGSTLIACEQTGRRCYMMEIDPRYCQVIVDRWQAYTSKKPLSLTKLLMG